MSKTIITPKERLLIASQQLAGMQAHGYVMSASQTSECIDNALKQSDELIEKAGCEVYQEENHMWRAGVNDENGH